MNSLTIYSTLSPACLEGGVNFTTSGYAEIQCKQEDNEVSLEIDKGFEWNRTDLKELIQFLKAVRKLLPKDDE